MTEGRRVPAFSKSACGPPNPRLQRTPSAPPPSPLSRQPLAAGRNLNPRRAFAGISLFALAVSVASAQSEAAKVHKILGVGAFPVSEELTSMWLSAPGGRPLIMVFFHGPTGWHRTQWKTSSKFEKGMPGWAEFTSARARQRIWLDVDTGKAEIQSEKVSIADANTYAVVHMTEDPALQKVVPLGTFDLPRSREEPSSVILLHELPEIMEAIKRASGAGG